ncbi:hypothetical protein MP228_005940 [Amoeboaphelidium protococcarum]|nr:hypothetical protein MP228_005940 [Amoeboaphelidium protococcarum]
MPPLNKRQKLAKALHIEGRQGFKLQEQVLGIISADIDDDDEDLENILEQQMKVVSNVPSALDQLKPFSTAQDEKQFRALTYTKDSKRTMYRRQEKSRLALKGQTLKMTDFFKSKASSVETGSVVQQGASQDGIQNNAAAIDMLVQAHQEQIQEDLWHMDNVQQKLVMLRDMNTVSRNQNQIKISQHISYDSHRLLAVEQYVRLVSEKGCAKMASSRSVVDMFFKGGLNKARNLRSWANHFLAQGSLPAYTQGLHSRRSSFIDDEDVKYDLVQYLRDLHPEKRSPKVLWQYVNEQYYPEKFGVMEKEGGGWISIRTCQNWMQVLGFQCKPHQKTFYVDGHEREDVVKYRNQSFVPQLLELSQKMTTYENGTAIRPQLEENECEYVWITQDESTYYANDSKLTFWGEEDEGCLRPKSLGQSLMVSAFMCPCHGVLSEFRETIEPGKNRDGWWKTEDLVGQVQRIIPAFERLHPGMKAVFTFDASANHHSMKSDALVAQRLNKSDGGKAPILRDGYFTNAEGRIVVQKMQFTEADGQRDKIGVQKGIQTILQERGLWPEKATFNLKCKQVCNGQTNDPCCALWLLQNQPDFKAQKTWIEEIVSEAGHVFIAFPKYHCELNPIESVWGNSKQFTRANCDYSFAALKEKVPLSLDRIPLDTIQKYFMRCLRYCDAYRLGLHGKLAEFAVKRYSSHRRIPDYVLQDLEASYEAEKQRRAAR